MEVRQRYRPRNAQEFLAKVVREVVVQPVVCLPGNADAVLAVVILLVTIYGAHHAQSHDSRPQRPVGYDILRPSHRGKCGNRLSNAATSHAPGHALAEVGPYPAGRSGESPCRLVIVWRAEAVLCAEVPVTPAGSWSDLLSSDYDLSSWGAKSEGKQVLFVGTQRVEFLPVLDGIDVGGRGQVRV